jgi:hypothetical protein
MTVYMNLILVFPHLFNPACRGTVIFIVLKKSFCVGAVFFEKQVMYSTCEFLMVELGRPLCCGEVGQPSLYLNQSTKIKKNGDKTQIIFLSQMENSMELNHVI